MKKKFIIVAAVLLVVAGVAYALTRSREPDTPVIPQKPKAQINLIPLEERPFVTLQPLPARNELEFVIHDLKKPAASVEVTLEYDRNKGVLDAVLHTYQFDTVPLVEKIFLGSKSAGGHITYHEFVLGGTMHLEFSKEDYALETSWRYDDTQKQYGELSTSDGKFQLTLDIPIKQSKVIVMQSPGLPEDIDQEVLAGPYVVATVGNLPKTQAAIKIRLQEEVAAATIMGWDGTKWVEYKTTLDGKTTSANGTLVSTYIVVEETAE